MKISKDFMRIYMIPVVLFAGIIIAAAFTVFYTATVKTKDGRTIDTNWPKTFTLNFSQYIDTAKESPVIKKEGQALLEENNLWIQILDSKGEEISNYEKPDYISDSYQPYELLEVYQNGYKDYSVFIGSIDSEDSRYTYLIGFPLSISKITMYIDTARYDSGKLLIIATILLTFLLLIVITIFYNAVISKNLEKICRSLCAISSRSYEKSKNHHFFKDIYDGIDLLNEDIEKSDCQRKRDEKAKEEWLANITHDLKTPLVPIRGYAELLAEEENVTDAKAHQYGSIILKNVLYTEQLVDDLKLTYQLQSNMLPLKKEQLNLTRFVKELIIDILNMPDYEKRDITFTANQDEINTSFDSKLLRRALLNIIMNALKHNNPFTKIEVMIMYGDEIRITVADNGKGMTKEELNGLFNRYYRGTNTDSKAEGSGLGMAIAKQIIEAHAGKLIAESIVDTQTIITIMLPK